MSSLPVPPEFHEVIPAFPLSGRLMSAAPHGSGHINETYAATFATDAGPRRYIFQKINHRIFKNVPGLMENVQRVTAHLANKVRAAQGEAAARGRELDRAPGGADRPEPAHVFPARGKT